MRCNVATVVGKRWGRKRLAACACHEEATLQLSCSRSRSSTDLVAITLSIHARSIAVTLCRLHPPQSRSAAKSGRCLPMDSPIYLKVAIEK
eukprot:2452340-Pleurochrysis_carterae.AAC.1